MTISSLKLPGSQSGYRDCEIFLSSDELGSRNQAICTDAATGIVIGAFNDCRATISADEVLRMIGGAYRLASIALEIETDELARRSRRIANRLRLRQRLWRRRGRVAPSTMNDL